MLFFTAVIAVATVAYVVCTILLWSETKKAAKAAKDAAGESKRSTDLLAALNRPYMGVHQVTLASSAVTQNDPIWRITWAIRNFGTLPALAVESKAEFIVGATVEFAVAGSFSAEVFPKSDPASVDGAWEFKGPRRDEVRSGLAPLIVRIHITYGASNGQRYKHRADAQWNRGSESFTVRESETQIIPATGVSVALS
jgi:hypothetical protein